MRNTLDMAFEMLEKLGSSQCAHLNSNLATHLQGTYMLLKDWNADENVCLAGLFHSVYGTYGFEDQLIELSQRKSIVAIIGDDAERLVYFFCACDRYYFFRQLITQDQPFFRDRFTEQIYPLPEAIIDSFCELTLANELEITARDSHHLKRYGGIYERLFDSQNFSARVSIPARSAYAVARASIHLSKNN